MVGRSILRTRAVLAAAVIAAVVSGCAAPGPTPVGPPRSTVPDPTAVPTAAPVSTVAPSAEPGAGLGCSDPVGAPDDLVLVDSDPAVPSALVVDAVSPDGARRRIAEVADIGAVAQARVTPCGHLAVKVGETLWVVDLAATERRVRMPDPVHDDAEWDVDRGGRVTLIDNAWGNVILFDPRDETVSRTPWNGDVRTFPLTAWDGGGWYAEVSPPDYESPPRRVGLVDGSAAFRRSAVLVFDPLGFAWRTRADGAQAWVRPTDDSPRTLDLVPVDGAPEVWRRIPPDRRAEAWAWDAEGRGLWLVERGPDGLHILQVAGPGEATEVAQLAASPAAWIAAVGPADTAMLFTSPAGEGPPVALVRADLATGAVTSLVDDLGAALVAGWAAPPELPPGLTPPVPFGAPEVHETAEDRPTAPDLPIDALAMVTCSANGTVVSRPDVRALEDGVHLLVRHPDGTAAGIEVDGIFPAYGYEVVSLPPGMHEIDCGEGPAPTPARLRVLDPFGLYRPAELGCAGGTGTVSSMDGDPVPGPEAAAWLRPQLKLVPGDVVRPAGYPDEAGPPITVVRDGRVVAIIRVLRAGDDLGVSSVERCGDANVGF